MHVFPDFCLLRNHNNLCVFSLEVLERRPFVAWKGSADLPPAHLAHGLCWKPPETLASSHCSCELPALPGQLRQIMGQMLKGGEEVTSLQTAPWLPPWMANASGVSQHRPKKCSNKCSSNLEHFPCVHAVLRALSTPGVVKVRPDSVMYGGWLNPLFST